MKAKYPGTLWVAMSRDEYRPAFGVYERKPDFKMASGEIALRYHLHPGNEVARALNVLSRTRKGILPYRYCAAVALRKAGFPVRWDVKAGRFV